MQKIQIKCGLAIAVSAEMLLKKHQVCEQENLKLRGCEKDER